jgi:hypothetical protein
LGAAVEASYHADTIDPTGKQDGVEPDAAPAAVPTEQGE